MVKKGLSGDAICNETRGPLRPKAHWLAREREVERLQMSRIIIVDDHPLFRAALRQTLAGMEPGGKVEEAGNLEALSAALEADRDCDLVLLDLNMPGAHGF